MIVIELGYSEYKLLKLIQENPEKQLNHSPYSSLFNQLLKQGLVKRIYMDRNGRNDYEQNFVTDKGFDAIREFERKNRVEEREEELLILSQESNKIAKKANMKSSLAIAISSIISIIGIVVSFLIAKYF